MDPLSITAAVIAILQAGSFSGQALNKLLSLRDAPQQLQQLWNEAEALRALLLETDYTLHRRREFDGYDKVEASITSVLHTVKSHVLELEQLVHFRLLRSENLDGHGLPKINRSYWLRAGPEIQRIKQNIRDSRELLKSNIALLGLDDSHHLKTQVLQIQRDVTLTSQDTIRKLESRQRKLQHEAQHLAKHTQQGLKPTQLYLKQKDAYTDASLVQMRLEQHQNFAALQASFTRLCNPFLLRWNR